LGRIVRSVSPEIAPIRCNHTQCGDRHPTMRVKWRQGRTQVLCVFRQNRRWRSPHPAPKSDATHQVLPQTWRHAAGFSIGHIWNKWHPASAAGRRNRALVPTARGNAVLGCMRSSQGVNEQRAERQSCAKPAPTRPQVVPDMGWECGSVQSEQLLRTWPPRRLQLLWGAVGAVWGVWEERRARRGAHFVPR